MRMNSREIIEAMADPGTWVSWDEPIDYTPENADYARELEAAREASGLDESITTGACEIRGHRVAAVVAEFGFLAGSIGLGAADRLVHAIRRATEAGLPLVAAPSSGGTRMQEGTGAFVQMLRITEAVAEHRRAGLPYLVYLRHPTTGGVFASWASLGHVIVAEPGALVRNQAGEVAAVEMHLADFVDQRAAEAIDERRFARSVRSDQAEAFALRDAQVDAVQRDESAEALAEA